MINRKSSQRVQTSALYVSDMRLDTGPLLKIVAKAREEGLT
jgi:hypothetical protein